MLKAMERIIIDVERLAGKLHRKRDKVCAELGMCRETLRKKLNGEISFKFSDIDRLAQALSLTKQDLTEMITFVEGADQNGGTGS